MIEMIKDLFKRFSDSNKPDIRFVPHTDSRVDIGAPVRPAKEFRAEWMKKQYANPPLKIAHCPGMWDYMTAGYIIPAWCDIHIKVNKNGFSVRMEGMAHTGQEAQPMDFALVDGMAPIKDGVKKCVIKIPMPWAVFAKAGISTHVVPAVMHSPFLDKIFVYSGIVDHDRYSTVNFIFSPLEECEFTIWAGTPLLQIIPVKRQDFTAECGVATERELGFHKYGFISRKPNFYRKMFHSQKKYGMKIKDDR